MDSLWFLDSRSVSQLRRVPILEFQGGGGSSFYTGAGGRLLTPNKGARNESLSNRRSPQVVVSEIIALVCEVFG